MKFQLLLILVLCLQDHVSADEANDLLVKWRSSINASYSGKLSIESPTEKIVGQFSEDGNEQLFEGVCYVRRSVDLTRLNETSLLICGPLRFWRKREDKLLEHAFIRSRYETDGDYPVVLKVGCLCADDAGPMGSLTDWILRTTRGKYKCNAKVDGQNIELNCKYEPDPGADLLIKYNFRKYGDLVGLVSFEFGSTETLRSYTFDWLPVNGKLAMINRQDVLVQNGRRKVERSISLSGVGAFDGRVSPPPAQTEFGYKIVRRKGAGTTTKFVGGDAGERENGMRLVGYQVAVQNGLLSEK